MKVRNLVLGTAVGGAMLWGIGRAITTRRVDLAGQVALVTGGSRGLGLEIGRRLVQEGCRVILVARDEKGLKAARQMLREEGGDVHTMAVDVTDQKAVERLAADVRERFGGLDILVNNASIIQVGPLESLDHKDFRDAMAVNYWGTVHTTMAFLDDLKARRGRIINIDSIGGRVAAPHLLPYTAAKFATYGFSEGLRIELSKAGVSVTTIVPGFMRTGSPTNAVFKGDSAREFIWFAAGDATLLTAMDPKRVARRVVAAAKRRSAVVVVGAQAKMLRLAHDVMPGTMPRLFSVLDRALPRATGPDEGRRGWEVAADPEAKPVARLIEHDAEKHNQFTTGGRARKAARGAPASGRSRAA